jgi:large subunit ribosomal protein L31
VFCDAKPICFVSSTKRQLNVDVWLSKHPFYTNSQTIIDTEGRVERFMKKYGLK